ncbi:MAG TPA: oligopeptide ABC transporter permease [Symbiobacteriaceae bacterium]|nr:oligopeptide ABC transporter permease [Symbiobacteriaceae bacterium]
MSEPVKKEPLQQAQEPVDGYQLSTRPESLWHMALKKFLNNWLAIVGLVVMLTFIALAALAPWVAPFDPAKIDLLNVNASPSATHWLGTDHIGRDVVARLLYGSRISLLVGFCVAIGTVTLGSIIGAIAGYFGGWVDNVLMRFIDVMLSFPALFLNILVLAIFGSNFIYLIMILVFTSWMGTARLVRGQFLQLREMQYVEAARAIGVPAWQVMFNHLLRNATGPIIVTATLIVGGAILGESGLSFLGLGVQPPQTSWGQMLSNSNEYMLTNPMFTVYPGACIFLTVLAVNFVGDGIRDALDPRQKVRIPKGRLAEWRARFSKSKA